MPTYQYECEECGYSFEKMQSITEGKLRRCPKCKEHALNRLIGTGSGFIFKGSGFYETDYKNKSTKPVSCPAEKANDCSCACPAKEKSSKSES